ncbi:response regulator [Baaleninema simplex]|uniref:response regulator n=1 Tax=Baaleninema simplex TaxID=2862350 RepID=UPI00034B0985|nr:response regulator [Baaleninema simplex]
MKILLVEDDEQLVELLSQYLSECNYIVDVATDGQTGLNYARTFDYDLLVLDVMLPKLDGIGICRYLRSQHYQMPILLLSALETSHDKISGLDAGADDYVVKPVGVEELLARIRALLRRGRYARPPVLTWERLCLDPATCEATYNDRSLSLTPKEYALLELFLRYPSRVFDRETIIAHLWSLEEPPTENTIRAHVKGLRTKLKAARAPADLIETVYGVGYRLKNADDMTSTPPIANSTMQTQPNSNPTLDAIQQVWSRVKPRALQRVETIERGANAIEDGDNDGDRLLARQEAHRLAGSLGTFGYRYGSQLARQIEALLSKEEPLVEAERRQLWQSLVELRQQLAGDPEPLSIEPPTTMPAPDRRQLLIVDDDTLLTMQIAEDAKTWGLETQVATTVRQARQAIVENPPSLILLDLNFPESDEDGLMLLEDLARNRPEIPAIVLTVRDSFNDRLAVSRLGARAFLQKPLTTTQILETTLEVLQRSNTAAKVLVVDDDVQELALLKALLQPWGLQVETLSEPRQFWRVLEAFTPDLLVLDLEMPDYSGIELCQVVRNEPQWRKLPVLFLTVRTDTDTVNRIFRVGADDYVSKPIAGPELIARLFNRLERTQLLQNLAELDPLTGVSNRRKSSYDITRLLRTCARERRVLSFALLDIDRFKQVNDCHGHAAGDLVLHRFGEVLRESFRPSDVVGRWGGEEFVVAAIDTLKVDGVRRLSEVLGDWRQQTFTLDDDVMLNVTFSAGVAQYPEDGEDLQTLYRAADEALYRAKNAGRDRIFGVST